MVHRQKSGHRRPFVNIFVMVLQVLDIYVHRIFLVFMSSVIGAATLLDFLNLKNRGGSAQFGVDGSHSMPSSKEAHKFKIFGILFLCIIDWIGLQV